MSPYKALEVGRIRAKVADIRDSLDVLRDYAHRSDQGFLGNMESVRAARYTLIVAIEAATNIANHLCSRLLSEAPASYTETFVKLGERGVIPASLTTRLARMTGLRNMLVHRYAPIDDRRVLAIIRSDLKDLEEFIDALNRVLQGVNHGDETI